MLPTPFDLTGNIDGVHLGHGSFPIRALAQLAKRSLRKPKVHKACFADHPKRVVFLKEELAGGVKADRACGVALSHFIRPLHDEVHCLVPGGLSAE
jgi:hypothetical protein